MVIESDREVSFSDAAYMTVITLSTVGFREPWPLSANGRLWTIGVISFGIVTVFHALGTLVSMTVSGELRSLRERQRMDKRLEQMKGHVILCGFGRMGALVGQELVRREQPFVAIDTDKTVEEDLRELGVHYRIGDATDDDVLLRAGLLHARALVIALPSDADNVYITLSARSFRSDITIIARAENPTTEAKLKRAGATRVICPQATGAMRIVDVLTKPTLVDFVELANKGVDLEIDEYILRDRSRLVGKTLRESHVRGATGAMVVAIKRAAGKAVVNPDPDAVLDAGDTLILVGPAGVSSMLDTI